MLAGIALALGVVIGMRLSQWATKQQQQKQHSRRILTCQEMMQ